MKPVSFFSQFTSPQFGALKVLTPNQQKKEPLSLLIQIQGPADANLDQGSVDTIAFVRSDKIATLSSAQESGILKRIFKVFGLGGKPGAEEWQQVQPDLVQLFGPNGDCHPDVAEPKQQIVKKFPIFSPHRGKSVIQVLREVHPQLYRALQDGTVTLAQGENPDDLLIRIKN